jgi:tetrahydromethanopterin S-methyltransferase subunit G
MQGSEREIESILLRLEEIVEQIYVTLASVKESEGITIGEQIDVLYDEKQRIIDALIHKVQNESSTLAAEEKQMMETKLVSILQKESVNLQSMEMYTNLLAHKLRQLQRQKSLRVYRGER